MVSNTEVSWERPIYSFCSVVPTSCYAAVPTQGVGHRNSLGRRTFWWHHNYELWYLVSHSFYKHKLRPQLITRSSWSASLPTLTAPEFSAGHVQLSHASASVMAVDQGLSPDPVSTFNLQQNHIPWKYNSLGSWKSPPAGCSLPEPAVKQHIIRRF